MKNWLAGLILVAAISASGFAGYLGGSILSSPEFHSIHFVTRTVTVSSSTSTLSICTNTGGIDCPHFFNEGFNVSVDYQGPWGVTYQGYLGTGETGPPAQSGSFYGHGPGSQFVAVSGTDTSGVTLCVYAQKLDASSSVLTVRFSPSTVNQTVAPYGVAKLCLADIIV